VGSDEQDWEPEAAPKYLSVPFVLLVVEERLAVVSSRLSDGRRKSRLVALGAPREPLHANRNSGVVQVDSHETCG
jgi:hypothetical protein